MDDQISSVILCQKNVQELFNLNQRLEKKIELQEAKISQIALQLAQRNEDLLSTIERYTPLKQFREETTHLRNYLDQKTRGFQTSFDQLQSYLLSILRQLLKQMTLLKEENSQYHQTTVEKVGRMTNTMLFQMESIEKKIHCDVSLQVEELTKKSGEMEQNFMKLFQQKHKLIEKLAMSQETQIAKINVFESTLHQQLSTISKIQTAVKQTPIASGRKLNFDSADVPLDMLKRQEDVLNYMTVSIKNIEKKLAETESKPKLKRELSFDQFSVQWSQQKPGHQQHQSLPASQIKPILINRGIMELSESQLNEKAEKSSRSDLASNVADPLQHEIRSPNGQSNIEISKSPLLNKVSPKPIIASPTPNLYEDIRLQQEYESKMQQIKEQEEKMRQSKIRQQQEYESKLSNLKKSQSLLSNESSLMKNDSYFLKQEAQIGRNDSQEIKKSSSGLRSLMERSKEREQTSTQPSKQNLNLSNQMKRNPFQQKIESPTKQALAPMKSQTGAAGGRKSRTNQMKNLAQQQQRQKQDQSADEIVYQLDEDGYLMDENGNYLLDERGNYIQISDKDLEELKKQNLVVEQD